VCSPNDLKYYPRHIDLTDSTRFDIEQPQRVMSAIAASLGVQIFDLREAMLTNDQCLYQPRNMHWTVDGHQVVSKYLLEELVETGYLP
jgi:hypothetical protein